MISEISWFLPTRVEVNEIFDSLALNEQQRRAVIDNGIKHIPSDYNTTYEDMFLKCKEKMTFDNNVSHIIFCHSIPTVINVESIIEKVFCEKPFMNSKFVVLSGQPCAIVHSAIKTAEAMLSEMDILVIGCDKASSINERYFFNTLMGDSCVFIKISRRLGHKVLSSYSLTNVVASKGELSGNDILKFRQDQQMFVRATMKNCVEYASMSFVDLDKIVVHTASTKTWDSIATLTKINRNMFLDDFISDTGHLNSNDSWIHFARFIENKTILAGEKVLLVNPGFGGTTGCTLIEVGGAQ